MRLKKILKTIGVLKEYPNVKIKGFTRNEDEIEEGFIYFSFSPLTIKKFNQLKTRGASYIIGETEFYHKDYIEVLSVKKSYQQLLYSINKHKLKNKVLIGVTGTNGKTTVSTLIYNFLSNKQKTIYYGSNGIYKDQVYHNANTTPSMEVFFKYLTNEKYVIVELSSISFFEYRMFNISFNYFVLTNIYEDHLDYHLSSIDYYYSKLLILSSNAKASLIMSDEIKNDKILRLNYNTYKYGISDIDYNVTIIKNHSNTILISNNITSIKITTNLECNYNIYNLLASIKLLYVMGYSLKEIEEFYNKPIEIKGRLNKFYYKDKTIIIDYPHTASAYEILFRDLKEDFSGKWLVVFGAGGNRQESKRKDYSNIVSKYASYAIITNDNPRFEDENKIANDIASYLTIPYDIILDRKQAIFKALSMINNFNLILILGKGREDYIEIEGNKYYHNDIETVLEFIK